MNAPLNPESFRSLLRELHEESQFASLSSTWRKNPKFDVLLAFARANKRVGLLILTEEIDVCHWQALDLIHELLGSKHEVLSETFSSHNQYHQKCLRLYRYAMAQGHDTEKIFTAYTLLRQKLAVERRMERVVVDLDYRRANKSIKPADWMQARRQFLQIALRHPGLCFDCALNQYLLWRGYNTTSPDAELVQLMSDVMASIVPAPANLARARTPAEIYFAWFHFNSSDGQGNYTDFTEN